MRKDADRRRQGLPLSLSCRAQSYLQPRPRGFTFTELLASLGLVAVSTLALDGVSAVVDNSRADSAIEGLRTALALTRSEAISRGTSTVLCRADGALSGCAGTTAVGRPDWQGGWLLFSDQNQDKRLDPDDGDRLLRVFPPLNPTLRLKWNRGDYIAYHPAGHLHSLNGTFCLQDSGGQSQRELRIPYSGRVRITAGECSYVF